MLLTAITTDPHKRWTTYMKPRINVLHNCQTYKLIRWRKCGVRLCYSVIVNTFWVYIQCFTFCWMSQDPTNDKWSLVHVTALRRQETRLFPSQLWSRFCPHMTLLGRTEYWPTNIVNSHILTHNQLGVVLRKIYTIIAMRSVFISWWRHQIETSSALLALCVGNSLICAWINVWVSNHEAGDLRRHRAHYNVIVVGY